MNDSRAKDDGGSVLALHEVLMEELGTSEPLNEEDERDFAEYHRLAAEAQIRRLEREAVLSSANPKAEEKEASCALAQDAERRCLNPLARILHRRKRSALCFSGGGIRSATFSLGVLQTLAKHSLPAEGSEEKARLLAEFDFLSTVSGGGYIGSWFSSWVRRAGLNRVLRHLAYRTTGKLDPEAKPLLHLRDYTNYLDPKLGLFSGDTWTLVATTVRNILLNWLVLLPFVAAALLIPVLFEIGLLHPLPSFNWLLWVGFACGVIGTGGVLHNLPSFGNAHHSEKMVSYSCLLPLVAAAICISVWWCWLDDATARAFPRLNIVLFGAAIHLGGVVVGALLSKLAHSENFSSQNLKPLRLAFACVAAVLTGALGAWLVSLVARSLHPQSADDKLYFACFAVPLVLATLMAVGMFSVGISSKVTDDSDREWWSRAGALMLIATVAWLVFFSKVLLLPKLVLSLDIRVQGCLSALSAALAWYVTKVGSKSDSRPAQGSQTTADSTLSARLNSLLLPAGALLFLLAVGFTLTMTNRYLAGRLHGVGIPFATAFLLVFEVALALLASYAVNVNKFSLHAMYRMRLIRAYLGASNVNRKPNPFTGFDPNDNIAIQDLSAEKPLHILNLCLNLVSGAKLAWQQRKAESFTMSRLHSGSFRVGYQPSSTYGHGHSKVPNGLSLGTAMAISGAAASPNMGYHSSPLAAIVMTLFNARMGWWLANPGEAGRRFWDKDGPAFGIKPFLDEALGNTDDENRYVYLSDGGHFENLAIYEMVLRRCKYIVAIDAGADEDYTKEDLGAAVRKIRIDMGIPIEFPQGLEIDKILRGKGKRCALGRIRYDLIDAGAEPGEILYIKPVIIGNEPADVANYASVSVKFPQEPTSDQWFNEAQFESYRSLGAFTIQEIVDTQAPVSVTELFRRAERYLSNESARETVQTAAAGLPV
jgi:hypothetical protein